MNMANVTRASLHCTHITSKIFNNLSSLTVTDRINDASITPESERHDVWCCDWWCCAILLHVYKPHSNDMGWYAVNDSRHLQQMQLISLFFIFCLFWQNTRKLMLQIYAMNVTRNVDSCLGEHCALVFFSHWVRTLCQSLAENIAFKCFWNYMNVSWNPVNFFHCVPQIFLLHFFTFCFKKGHFQLVCKESLHLSSYGAAVVLYVDVPLLIR